MGWVNLRHNGHDNKQRLAMRNTKAEACTFTSGLSITRNGYTKKGPYMSTILAKIVESCSSNQDLGSLMSQDWGGGRAEDSGPYSSEIVPNNGYTRQGTALCRATYHPLLFNQTNKLWLPIQVYDQSEITIPLLTWPRCSSAPSETSRASLRTCQ